MEKLQGEELRRIYERRFAGKADYRIRFWKVLAELLSQWIPPDSRVLELERGIANSSMSYRKNQVRHGPEPGCAETRGSRHPPAGAGLFTALGSPR
jgi:hypothetical protein